VVEPIGGDPGKADGQQKSEKTEGREANDMGCWIGGMFGFGLICDAIQKEIGKIRVTERGGWPFRCQNSGERFDEA
jgi:hypothetical protein